MAAQAGGMDIATIGQRQQLLKPPAWIGLEAFRLSSNRQVMLQLICRRLLCRRGKSMLTVLRVGTDDDACQSCA